VKVAFDEFDYGFVYRRIRSDTDENDELWTVGRVCLWPNALYTGHFEWRVPIDDENTLSVAWFVDPVPGDAPFEQQRIPYWHSPIKDEATGRWISSHTMQQDFIAWVGQGTIADRTQEHLGESDRGVIMIRRRFQDDMKIIADGGEPKGILRDESANHEVFLPRTNRRTGTPPVRMGADGYPVSTAARLLYGEPQSVREEMKAAWESMAQPAGD
jgi:5,5'-dehydrodivanillate O-demethylase